MRLYGEFSAFLPILGGNGQLISIKGDVHVPSLIQINAAQVRAVRCGGCHTLGL